MKKCIIQGIIFIFFGVILVASSVGGVIVAETLTGKIIVGVAFLFFGVFFLVEGIKLVMKKGSLADTIGKIEQNPAEDVIRVPVEYDDEAGRSELEKHTKSFLETLKYPAGFEEFVRKFNRLSTDECFAEKKFFIRPKKQWSKPFGSYWNELYDIYDFDGLKEVNFELIVQTDDYFTQFRDVLFFADDDGGHCHFLLDYGKNKFEPSVKYLDDELDIVELLANSFTEFVNRLVAENDPAMEEPKKKFSKELRRTMKRYDKSNR